MRIVNIIRALFAAALMCAGIISAADAQATLTERDAEIRAAMVLNFVRFADQPERGTEGTPLLVCISQGADIEMAVYALNNQVVDGQHIQVIEFQRGASPDCSVAYLAGTDATPEIVEDQAKQGALIVSSERGFVSIGMIEIVSVGRQTRFKVNNTNAQSADIKLSSRLLRLAVEVR